MNMNRTINITVKKALGIFAVVTILIAIFAFFVTATPGTGSPTIIMGNGSITATSLNLTIGRVLPYTWTISTQNGILYSEASNGSLVYVDTNASNVWNWTLAHTSSGGSIYGQAGLYSIDYAIQLLSNIKIDGDKGCKLQLTANRPVDEQHTNVFDSFSVDVENITMANIDIDGNLANNLGATSAHCGNGVYIHSSGKHIFFEDLTVQNNRRIGLEIRANPGKITTDVWVQRCTVDYNGYNDIEFQAYDNTAEVYGCTVDHCTTGWGTGDISINSFQVNSPYSPAVHDITVDVNTIGNMTGIYGSSQNPYAWYGVKLERGGFRWKITNNMMLGTVVGIQDDGWSFGSNTYSGNTIYLKDYNVYPGYSPKGIATSLGNCTITQNTIIGSSTQTQAWTGIYVANTGNCTVTDNTIIDYGGSGSSVGIDEYGTTCNGDVFSNNNVQGCKTVSIFMGQPSKAGGINLPNQYTIYTDGTTTYMQNSLSDVAQYQNTDPAKVLNFAIGNMSQGSILWRAGNYTLTHAVILASNVSIDGQDGTILTLGNNVTDSYINGYGNFFLARSDIANVTIRNIQINGNKLNNYNLTAGNDGNGIYFQSSATNVKIEDVTVQNCRMQGIMFKAGSGKSINDTWIINSVVKGNGRMDILLQSYDISSLINGFHVINNFCGGDTSMYSICAQNVTSPADGTIINLDISHNTIDAMTGNQSYASSPSSPFQPFGILIQATSNSTIENNNVLGASVAYCDNVADKSNFWMNNRATMEDANSSTSSYYNKAFQVYGNYSTYQGNHVEIPVSVLNVARGFYLTSPACYNSFLGNTVIDEGNANTTTGIFVNPGCTNNVFYDNNLASCDTKFSITMASSTSNRLRDNIGWNPKGYIASPVYNGTGFAYLVDSGGNGTIQNSTTYTVDQSDKILYTDGGTWISFTLNGQVIWTTTPETVYLKSGDTFSIVYSVAPTTLKCMGS